MNSRRIFLEQLFRAFAAAGLPWCVLRNQHALFEESDSDVDLLTTPVALPAALEQCQVVAQRCGFVLVQHARFINHTLVFWDRQQQFLRIDFDTEQRWKRYPVLTAETILAARQPQNDYYIPHPAHEAMILLTQALWRGRLTERYANRIEELGRMLQTNPTAAMEWARISRIAPSQLVRPAPDSLLSALRREVRAACWRQPSRVLLSLKYWTSDLGRLWVRLRKPPGLSLRAAGIAAEEAEALLHQLRILFPRNKSRIATTPLSGWEIRKICFQGGLALECRSRNAAAPSREPQTDFYWRRMGDDEFGFHHPQTGRNGVGRTVPDCTRFICEALTQR